MFKENKYTKWYYSIIESAKNKNIHPDEYYERHHIIPKCIGGADTLDNIVVLTPREHFICHVLLTKMHDYYGLWYAVFCFAFSGRNQRCGAQREFVLKSRLFAIARERCNILRRASGKKIYHDSTGNYKRFTEGDMVPDDFTAGYTQDTRMKHRAAMVGRYKGWKAWYNPTTKHLIRLPAEITPPDGFSPGLPPTDTPTKKGLTRYIHNPETGVAKRIGIHDDVPHGWIPGNKRGMCRPHKPKPKKCEFYNPETGKHIRISEGDAPPCGFIKGRAEVRKQYTCDTPLPQRRMFYDIHTHKMGFTRTGELPEGCVWGQPSEITERNTARNTGIKRNFTWQRYYHPLTLARRNIRVGDKIPDGFIPGVPKKM